MFQLFQSVRTKIVHVNYIRLFISIGGILLVHGGNGST